MSPNEFGLPTPDEILGTGKKKKKYKRTRISKSIKDDVLTKQKYKCAGCGNLLPARKHFHHKKPVSQGGKNTVSNIIALCPNCHSEIHHKESVRKANKKAKSSTGKKKEKDIWNLGLDDII